MKFPKEFLWGSDIAASQCEGGGIQMEKPLLHQIMELLVRNLGCA